MQRDPAGRAGEEWYMKHKSAACERARQTLEHLLATGRASPLQKGVAAHISACPSCRARLVIMIHGLADRAGGTGSGQDCESVRRELPTFLDLERLDAARAVQTCPQLWRHIWTCAGCLEEYLSARALVEAADSGALPALRPPARPFDSGLTEALIKIVLPRRIVAMLLPSPQPVASPARGSESSSFVLFDHSAGDPPRQITIVVRELATGSWEMRVTAAPPVAGILLVTIGVKSFSAHFDEEGSAYIATIPAEALISTEEPDLEIAILPPRIA